MSSSEKGKSALPARLTWLFITASITGVVAYRNDKKRLPSRLGALDYYSDSMEKGEAGVLSDAVKKLIVGLQPNEGMHIARSSRRVLGMVRCIHDEYAKAPHEKDCHVDKGRFEMHKQTFILNKAEVSQQTLEGLKKLFGRFKFAVGSSYLPEEWFQKGASCIDLLRFIWRFTRHIDVKDTKWSERATEDQVPAAQTQVGNWWNATYALIKKKSQAYFSHRSQLEKFDAVMKKMAQWAEELDARIMRDGPLYELAKELGNSCKVNKGNFQHAFEFGTLDLYFEDKQQKEQARQELIRLVGSSEGKRISNWLPEAWRDRMMIDCYDVIKHMDEIREVVDIDAFGFSQAVNDARNEAVRAVMDKQLKSKEAQTCMIKANDRPRTEPDIFRVPNGAGVQQDVLDLWTSIDDQIPRNPTFYFPFSWIGKDVPCHQLKEFAERFPETGSVFFHLAGARTTDKQNDSYLGMKQNESDVGYVARQTAEEVKAWAGSKGNTISTSVQAKFHTHIKKMLDVLVYYRELATFSMLPTSYFGVPDYCGKAIFIQEVNQVFALNKATIDSCKHSTCDSDDYAKKALLYAECRKAKSGARDIPQECRGELQNGAQCPEGTECSCDAFVDTELLMKYNIGIFAGGNVATSAWFVGWAVLPWIAKGCLFGAHGCAAGGIIGVVGEGLAAASKFCDLAYEVTAMFFTSVYMAVNSIGSGCSLQACEMVTTYGKKHCQVKSSKYGIPFAGLKCIYIPQNAADARQYAKIIGGIGGVVGVAAHEAILKKLGIDNFYKSSVAALHLDKLYESTGALGTIATSMGGAVGGAVAGENLIKYMEKHHMLPANMMQPDGCYTSPCDMDDYFADDSQGRVGSYPRDSEASDPYPRGNDVFNCPGFDIDMKPGEDPYDFGNMQGRAKYYERRLGVGRFGGRSRFGAQGMREL